MTRALVCGWPSVPGGEATAGDLLTMQEVAAILSDRGFEVDVATNAGFPWGVDARTVPSDRYEHIVFVCGPLHGRALGDLVARFPDSNLVAVNVSVVDEAFAARFDTVIARDGRGEARPDLSFGCRPDPVPVIGVIRAHPQPEYPAADHEAVDALIRLVLASRPCATVDFDTRVHPAADPFAAHARSSQAVCSLAARMDVVIATRLHGAVLSLAQGTPVVAIDPIRGGAKVATQMRTIGWPCVFTAGDAESERVAQGIEWCLTDDARRLVSEIVARTAVPLARIRERVLAAVDVDPPGALGDAMGRER